MKRNAELLADYLEQMTGRGFALTGDAPAKDIVCCRWVTARGNPEGIPLV